jgi:hypothetical protein
MPPPLSLSGHGMFDRSSSATDFDRSRSATDDEQKPKPSSHRAKSDTEDDEIELKALKPLKPLSRSN